MAKQGNPPDGQVSGELMQKANKPGELINPPGCCIFAAEPQDAFTRLVRQFLTTWTRGYVQANTQFALISRHFDGAAS
jgi:hypothetical protein